MLLPGPRPVCVFIMTFSLGWGCFLVFSCCFCCCWCCCHHCFLVHGSMTFWRLLLLVSFLLFFFFVALVASLSFLLLLLLLNVWCFPCRSCCFHCLSCCFGCHCSLGSVNETLSAGGQRCMQNTWKRRLQSSCPNKKKHNLIGGIFWPN